MSAHDSLQRMAFDGIEFPYERYSVKGGLRDHVHEYPHSPGGAPEKLGRKLYVIEVTPLFHDTLAAWPNLYPIALDALFEKFESGTTAPLLLPTIGLIDAYAFEWSRETSARVRSGERVSFNFREDQADAFLAQFLTQASSSSLKTAHEKLVIEAEATDTGSLFDSLNAALGLLTALADQAELYGNQLAAQALAVSAMCDQLDASLSILQQPVNHELLDALHGVWDSALALHKDALKRAIPVLDFVVPVPMAISDVARSVYGDGSRAVEILKMNPIDDAFNIPANTTLRVYAPGG